MAQPIPAAYETRYARSLHQEIDSSESETESSDSEADDPAHQLEARERATNQVRTLIPATGLAHYNFHTECGKGTFGVVYKASPSFSQDVVAIKIFEGAAQIISAPYKEALDELKMLIACRNLPHVLQLKGWGTDLFSDKFFITTNLLESIPEKNHRTLDQVRKIAKGIFTGLAELHRKNIIHGDIKPRNCLMNAAGEGVVADLGSATYKNEKRPWPVQTIMYRDPRVFIKAPYDHTIDLWGVGCTLAMFAVGSELFPGTPNEHSDEDYFQELHTLHLIVQLLGMPPTELLCSGEKSHFYFRPQGLKELPSDYQTEQMSSYNYIQLRQYYLAAGQSEKTTDNFVALLGRLVTYGEKISAEKALDLPFFSNQN